MTFLTVFGHVVVDHLFRVDRLPDPDTTMPVSDRTVHFGGTAGNLARAAARLGVDTALAAFVGEDFPEAYRAALEAEGVDLTDLAVVPGHRTPSAWIFADSAGNQVTFIDQGAMAETAEVPVQERAVDRAQLVHLGTGQPAYYLRVLQRARGAGKRVAFDPAQEIHYVYDAEALRALLAGSDLFFANRVELARALKLLGLQDPRELLELTDALVLTRGEECSLVYTQEARWKVPAVPPQELVDIIGAGDAYRAGFYAGLQRELELPLCALLGASVASFCLQAEGPQAGLPTWDEAWGRASQHRRELRRLRS